MISRTLIIIAALGCSAGAMAETSASVLPGSSVAADDARSGCMPPTGHTIPPGKAAWFVLSSQDRRCQPRAAAATVASSGCAALIAHAVPGKSVWFARSPDRSCGHDLDLARASVAVDREQDR